MNENFSRTLSLLRKEKGVSQRAAAGALGISQALLSHYEKGAREPGLAFVARACDYYEVSSDYLLGRTLLRNERDPEQEDIPDASAFKDNKLQKGVTASLLLQKKLLINSVSLLFDLLGKTSHKGLLDTAAAYLGDAVYTVFRYLYDASGDNTEKFFSMPPALFSLFAKADMAVLEARLRAFLHGNADKATAPALSHDWLTKEYPLLYQSLYMLLQQTGVRLEKLK